MDNRLTITGDKLDILESAGFSEEQIAKVLKCSRMGLYKYRRKIGCPQKIRCGKGLSKYTAAEHRALKNKFQREHWQRNIERYGHGERFRDRKEQKRIVLQVLNRPLKAGECIHHIDNNPANNTHSNLVICTKAYHRCVFHTKRAEQIAGIAR